MITKPSLRTLQINHTPPPGETHQSRRQRQRLFQAATLAISLRNNRLDAKVMQRDMLLYKEIVLELRKTPPVGLTLDLIQLWRVGGSFLPRSLGAHEQPLQRLYLQLQNEVFHRLLRIPQFLSMHQSLKDLALFPNKEADEEKPYPSVAKQVRLSLEERALVFLTAQLFKPVSHLLMDSFRPHAIHELQQPRGTANHRPGQRELNLEEAEWVTDPLLAMERFEASIGMPGWVREYHEDLIQHWLRVSDREWLHQGQSSILQYMEQLNTPLQRIRWQQLHQTASLLAPASNLHSLIVLRDLGYREWKVPTSSTKPEGGYSGLARRGDIASLLPSELLFWREDMEVNPFMARWLENECLFYEREQSHSYTRHRTVQFVLDLSPGEIRYKSPEAPSSGLTVLFALLTRLSLDLRQVCPEEVLSFHYSLGPSDDWTEDAPLLPLFLSHQPEIGASTDFTLWEQPLQQLDDTPPGPQQLRIYVGTPSRWEALSMLPSTPTFHMGLWVTPSEEPAPKLATFSLHLQELDGELTQLPALRDRMLELILQTPL
ncbi:MAG: hypothetical protein EP343_10680 [Deltaproteobacteria bacterium]|nr:MAG: hypothetical protein EP343_10680 [Deltaproteobacteria bacterium]